MALLRDLAPKGAVYVIAAKCDDIMAARDLSKIDWPNPAKRKEVGHDVYYGKARGRRWGAGGDWGCCIVRLYLQPET